MPTLHDYPIAVEWAGGRDGKGKFTAKHSGASLDIAVPPEFQGPGGAVSPEELLTSAIASCYTVTFGIIAANRKLPVEDIQVEAVGQVEQNGPSFKYTSVTVRPRITLASEATDDQVKLAEDMAHKADSYCIVTNAVRASVQIVVEPQVARA
ncbi:MAG TPA: OsmC family protein [Fimbriimonadaceae bacterium]|nr:OsmC family protein [Fimbriimonadaceae bacterium]